MHIFLSSLRNLLKMTGLLFFLLAPAAAQQHALRLGEVRSESAQPVEIPVYFSSDSSVTFVQFIFEYNSAQLFAQTPLVELGNDAGGLTISIVNDTLPFQPVISGADKNVLVQLSGGGTQAITGDSWELVTLKFATLGE